MISSSDILIHQVSKRAHDDSLLLSVNQPFTTACMGRGSGTSWHEFA